jgi:hypothetical protein
MADNRNKTGNQDNKQQQQPMNKPQRPAEKEQQGNRGNVKSDKDVGNENREIQKDLDTDETDQGELDEQGEITQRNPRQGDDEQRR